MSLMQERKAPHPRGCGAGEEAEGPLRKAHCQTGSSFPKQGSLWHCLIKLHSFGSRINLEVHGAFQTGRPLQIVKLPDRHVHTLSIPNPPHTMVTPLLVFIDIQL